jgi:hypothetical protein
MLSYLRGREFLSVVYDTRPQEEGTANRIQGMAQYYNLHATIAAVSSANGETDGDELDAYRKVVREIKMSGIKTVAKACTGHPLAPEPRASSEVVSGGRVGFKHPCIVTTV